MPTLLVIEVSPRFDHSTSRKPSTAYIGAWRTANPGGTVVVRDPAKAAARERHERRNWPPWQKPSADYEDRNRI